MATLYTFQVQLSDSPTPLVGASLSNVTDDEYSGGRQCGGKETSGMKYMEVSNEDEATGWLALQDVQLLEYYVSTT